MISIIFSTVLSLSCPEPKIILIEGLTWDEEDEKIVSVVTQGCVRHYGEKSCLVSITKKGERNYHVVCRDGIITD